MTAEESLEMLKMTSPQGCPNAGFMRQVDLFVRMGCEQLLLCKLLFCLVMPEGHAR
jgi:hypothetical protein